MAARLVLVLSSCCYTLWLAFSTAARVFTLDFTDQGANEAYVAPWMRCPVYLIAMLCGFFWHTECRGRKSTLHDDNAGDNVTLIGYQEKFISSQPTAPVVMMTAVLPALLLALPVYVAYWICQDVHEWSVPLWARNLYLAFSRPTWALGLCLMCALCFSGNGGLMNWLLT